MSDQDRFASLLHQCVATWRSKVEERLRPWQATFSTWRLLNLLMRPGQRFNQSALARQMGIETPTVVKMIDRLEALRWVRREADPVDRRQKMIVITPEGMALHQEIQEQVFAVRREMLSGLSASEVSAGIELIEKILNHASNSTASD